MYESDPGSISLQSIILPSTTNYKPIDEMLRVYWAPAEPWHGKKSSNYPVYCIKSSAGTMFPKHCSAHFITTFTTIEETGSPATRFKFTSIGNMASMLRSWTGEGP